MVDQSRPFEPEISPLQIDPARALLPEGSGAAGIMAAEATHTAMELWEQAQSWEERARALQEQHRGKPISLRPTAEEIEFASDLVGGFTGLLESGGKSRSASALAPRYEFATRYPEVGPRILKDKATDKPIGGLSEAEGQRLVEQQKAYWSKGETDESRAVAKMRQAAQKDISAGNYTPYFDVSKRADVDPAKYAGYESTSTLRPKMQAATKRHTEAAYAPEATTRLEEAYLHGLKIPNSENFYFMQQLEQEFVKHLGEAEGRAQFQARFTKPMAATTAGADPTSNLMMGAYGNYMRETGQAIPGSSAEMPYPIADRKGNLQRYKQMLIEGKGISRETNPKRYNFNWNFLGQKGPTIDEQMWSLISGKKGGKPPDVAWGIYQQAIEDLAVKHGVDSRYFQEVAWAGHKALTDKSFKVSKPMIQHVNEAIERTSRITGLPPDEVVKRALVYAQMPLYGAVGVVAADKIAGEINERYQDETAGRLED